MLSLPLVNAGLPASKARVRVGPPLNCSGPSLGSLVTVITIGGGTRIFVSMTRLLAPDKTPCPDATYRSFSTWLGPAVLFAMMLLCSVSGLLADGPLKYTAP